MTLGTERPLARTHRGVITALLPLLSAALALPAPAPAQDQGADAPIQVIGNRKAEKERREQIRDFVRALSTEPTNSPLTRFHEACPVAIGLSPAQNAAIAKRMRAVAAAGSVPLAKDDCQPNVLVVVVPGKEEMFKLLRKKHPVLFINGNNESVDVVEEEGPVTAWHVQVSVDRNDRAFLPDYGVAIPSLENGPSSRLLSPVRPLAIGAIVLIEQKGLVGLTTTQVADYAAMRAFTTLHPGRLQRTKAPTILTVMNSRMGDETPLSLTRWDLGFLKGVYAGNPFRYAGTQRSQISGAIIRDVKKEEAEAAR